MTHDNAPIDSIGRAPLESPTASPGPVGTDPLSSDPDLPRKLGWLGRCFGHGEEKKGNLVAVALIFCGVMVAILICAILLVENGDKQSTILSMFTPLVAILSGLIGYLTGNNGNKN